MKRLRRDVIVHRPAEGGVEIVDTLLERAHRVPEGLGNPPEPGAAVTDVRLAAWLEAELLTESPVIDQLRLAGWAARARRTVRRPTLTEAPGPWHRAPELPDWIASAWRAPERWRRLGEARAAGQRLLRLEGLLTHEVATRWRDVASCAATTRCDNAYASGYWDQDTAALPDWRDALTAGPLHDLLGAALGLALPAAVQLNAWRLGSGDRMAMHSDGTRYAATVSLGLCPDWRAVDGGAIAFGWPTEAGLEVRERWLPQLGDALAFAVEAMLWHAVEPVACHERVTLTAQYLVEAA